MFQKKKEEEEKQKQQAPAPYPPQQYPPQQQPYPPQQYPPQQQPPPQQYPPQQQPPPQQYPPQQQPYPPQQYPPQQQPYPPQQYPPQQQPYPPQQYPPQQQPYPPQQYPPQQQPYPPQQYPPQQQPYPPQPVPQSPYGQPAYQTSYEGYGQAGAAQPRAPVKVQCEQCGNELDAKGVCQFCIMADLINSTEKIIEGVAAKGLDASRASQFIEEARAALRERDFEGVKDAVEQAEALTDQLSGMTGEIEGEIKVLEEMLAGIKSGGVDVSQAERVLHLARSFMRTGNIEKASQFARKSRKMADEAKTRQRVDAQRGPPPPEEEEDEEEDEGGTAAGDEAQSLPDDETSGLISTDLNNCPTCGNILPAPRPARCPFCESDLPQAKPKPAAKKAKKAETVAKEERKAPAEAAPPPPAAGPGEIACPSCGNSVESGWKRCPFCTHELEAEEKPAPGPAPMQEDVASAPVADEKAGPEGNVEEPAGPAPAAVESSEATEAKQTIDDAEAGIAKIEAKGLNAGHPRNLLKLAHSFQKGGSFDKALRYAKRAQAAAAEMLERAG